LLDWGDLRDIFFVKDTTQSINIELEAYGWSVSVNIHREDKNYLISIGNREIIIKRNRRGYYVLDGDFRDRIPPIYYYNFSLRELPPRKKFERIDILLPPSGINLLHIIREYGELREIIGDFLNSRGLELLLKMGTGELAIQGRVGNIVFEIPLWLLSDSLLRLFVVLAIRYIYRNTIFALEEPESKSYPYYTKVLAEQIALDHKNIYLISTHNPYLLLPLVEKVRKDEVKIFLTSVRNCETSVQELSKEQIERILGGEVDPFISIEDLLYET